LNRKMKETMKFQAEKTKYWENDMEKNVKH
jgi:hypothetical protein